VNCVTSRTDFFERYHSQRRKVRLERFGNACRCIAEVGLALVMPHSLHCDWPAAPALSAEGEGGCCHPREPGGATARGGKRWFCATARRIQVERRDHVEMAGEHGPGLIEDEALSRGRAEIALL